MSIATYLTALDRDRDALAVNLTTKGVPASSSETFTTLVPKVLDIPSGGGSGIEWNSSFTINNSTYLEMGLKEITIKDIEIINSAKTQGYQYAFYMMRNLEKITCENVVFPDLCLYFFNYSYLTKIKEITIKNCRFPSSSSANSMFSKLYTLTKLTLNGFDTTNVTTLDNMFINAPAQITGTNTITAGSSLTRIDSMFYGCTGLEKDVDLSGMVCPNVTNLNQMFYGCTSIETIDLSNITGTVTNISNAFNGCTSLKTIDISGMSFSISSSADRAYLFNGVPENCTIYVKNAATQTLLTSWDNTHTYSLKS